MHPSSPDAPRGSLIGRTLAGNYLIERKLGDGGMGTVYLARHTRLPTRLAIKVLNQDPERSEEMYLRFRHEAEITSALRHPNIVQATDYDRLEDGTIYLVMEYLEGEDLHGRIKRRGRLPLAEVMPLSRQLGSALTAAHRQGVVHRDLKPQNVFLSLQDHGDREVEVLKVLDFGISKIRGGSGDLTQIGRILGTPQFMAPEQALGHNHLIDARTDQFALGAILYYALSGQLPFRAPETAAVLYLVINVDPPPLRELVPVPRGVSSAVARAMAKRPEDRFPAIVDLLRALEAAAQETVLAGPAPKVTVPSLSAQAETVVFNVPELPTEPDAGPAAAAAEGRVAPVSPGPPLPPFGTTLSASSGAIESLAPPRPRASRSPVWPWLLCGALLCAGSGAWLRSRARRHAPPAAPVPAAAPVAAPSPVKPPAPGEDAVTRLFEEGEAQEQREDFAAARRSFEQALGRAPESVRARVGLGRIELEQHNFAAAVPWLKEAAAREPQNPQYQLLLCQAYFRLKDNRGTRAACGAALRLDPSLSEAAQILRSIRR